MVSPKIEKIIAKYLTKQASSSELDELLIWLEEGDNEKELLSYVKVNYAIDFNMKEFDTNRSKKELLEFINKEKKVYALSKVKNIMKYAALFILLLGLGYLYNEGFFTNKTPESIISGDSITLELENGDIEILSEDGSKKVVDKKGNVVGTQNGSELLYVNDAEQETLVYNTLTIPYGKRFKITLSDGTNVHLNSGSSLKYPVNFIKGETRKVYLDGEGYFAVAKNASNPFIVNSETLNVEVLGTEFNVSAYPEDATTDVVLIEGSVGLYVDSSTLEDGTVITPGTKGALNKANKSISTEEVNTFIYTSWRQGGLFFRNMPFKNIVKKMERHYNVKIIVTNNTLNSEVFSANFNDEPITKILSYFNDSYDINYTIKDNTIYIN
ncbi:FecR family protein [Flavivirga eckloniae]|uniref:Iron dicitrate transport regulator FecR n=1 Tax=Flavivirga eckloniae TaxID=1803846 RepID=A0A2K9PQT5_9FLAO|nr:FecR family protein [Flavivirga eckloniae]AUP78937.1 iron dicitrate transport regulator FecR [Flavivirga eckloniae]